MDKPPSVNNRSDDSEVTLVGLNQIKDQTLTELSALSVEEVQQIKREIATVLPAGTLPGLILSGLAQIKGRRVSKEQASQDIATLFKGADLLPQALYAVVYGGPAVVLSAYQKLLQLTGHEVDDAFPEGTWQFYLQFGLREDTGRHTCETTGYHLAHRDLNDLNGITTWLMTAIHTIFDNDALNGAIWTEWTTLRLLKEASTALDIAHKPPFNTIIRDWQLARPYQTPAGSSYASARLTAFEQFIVSYYQQLPVEYLARISNEIQRLASTEQNAYQDQMSLLAYLEPGEFSDERIPIPIWDASVGLVWKDHVYLFDACQRDAAGLPIAETSAGERWSVLFDGKRRPMGPDGRPLTARGSWLYHVDKDTGAQWLVGRFLPPEPAFIKSQVNQVLGLRLEKQVDPVDQYLRIVPRQYHKELRGTLSADTQEALERLRRAPVLINWDMHDTNKPLGEIRRFARRGIGDHALTVIRTENSMIFDLGHVFFDGVWGMAIAEVMTSQATSWADYLPAVETRNVKPMLGPLPTHVSGNFMNRFNQLNDKLLPSDVNAETDNINMRHLNETRAWLKHRGVRLTINDLLLISRTVHALLYQPSDDLLARIKALPPSLRRAVTDSLANTSGNNPSLLIPMDASFVSPKERIFPTTYRNSLEMLVPTYQEAVQLYHQYREDENPEAWQRFAPIRNRLFTYLASFGEMLDTVKAIGMRGESFSNATIRMLAHLPQGMQHLLDQIPQRIGVLNEIIKGEEVFSNVGRVAEGSTLRRFMSAKDDGRAKLLVWGIMTDNAGRMLITLRDFRTHIGPLLQAGHRDLAEDLAQHYLDAYAETLGTLGYYLKEFASVDLQRKS